MPDLDHQPPRDKTRPQHEVAVCPPPGEYAANEDRWELDCDVCGYVGAADSEQKAWEMARMHSAMRSVGERRCDLEAGVPRRSLT